MKKLIEIRNVAKSFDGQAVLKGINLDIYQNEFVTLLGPSGCGKTTLLRIIGGFIEQDQGQVYINGEEITKTPAYKRPINTVFQRYALFPHLNVFDNVAFGLNIKKLPKDLIKPKVDKMLSLVGLDGYQNKDVNLLSGGQQQRVAIARALVNEPEVLLLDEPLSALDAKLRKEMQRELKRIQQEVGITFIFVTHDQEEALTMSDKIVLMKEGLLEQIGTPTEIYNEPINRYAATFIGESNIIDATMKKDYLVNFDEHDFDCIDFGFKENEKVDVVIRPEDIKIKEVGMGKLNGQVISVLFKGVHYETLVETKKGASKTITLHVFEDKDIFNEEANEKISATNFFMDIEDVKKISDLELIQRANAQAWDPSTEEEILIETVEHNIKEEAGKYTVTFKTNAGTAITTTVFVVLPKESSGNTEKIGIQAFDVYKSVQEIKESMAISLDLITWADACAWRIGNDAPVEIDDVRFDFDPNEISEGDYEVTFLTLGREYKVRTTECFKEDQLVSIDFDSNDIHCMSKEVNG